MTIVAETPAPVWDPRTLPCPALCSYPGAGYSPCLVCGQRFYGDDELIPVRRFRVLWVRGWVHGRRHPSRSCTPAR